MENTENYIYPWVADSIQDGDKELYWISTYGLNTDGKKIDWAKVREVLKS